jgi:serine/threonine protein kinase
MAAGKDYSSKSDIWSIGVIFYETVNNLFVERKEFLF